MVESTFLNQRAILVAEWRCCVREVSHALTVSHPKTSIVRKYAPPSAQALRGADVVRGAGRRTLAIAGAPAPHCEGAADDSLS